LKEIALNSLTDLPELASLLIESAAEKRVFLFKGQMGAGKTTLIKALCGKLGVEDHVTSPTFSIVNEYLSKSGPVYHFDFYRLKDEQEAYDLGYEEYFYSGNYCFVEWPQKIQSLLPDNAFTIDIELNTDQSRLIRINP